MTRARTLRLLVLLPLLATAGVCAAAPRVLVVLSRPDGAYLALAQAISANLPPARATEIQLRIENLADFTVVSTEVRPPALIVTVGVEAAQRVARANPSAPVLHTLLPRAAALEILKRSQRTRLAAYRDSAIFLDQPIGRQLDLIRTALPQLSRIAVVLGAATQPLAPELRAAARERGLSLDIATVARRDDLLPALENLLGDNDVLLSVADPMVFHSETIHHVLLTAYRHKVPLIGLSRSYVDAGALLAVFSTPEQIGEQVAQLVAAVPASGSATLPAPGYPKLFQVAINPRVAASLNLALGDEAALRQKLETPPRP
jgi:ABC-type uncharacterized transport system substrate-binding protein